MLLMARNFIGKRWELRKAASIALHNAVGAEAC